MKTPLQRTSPATPVRALRTAFLASLLALVPLGGMQAAETTLFGTRVDGGAPRTPEAVPPSPPTGNFQVPASPEIAWVQLPPDGRISITYKDKNRKIYKGPLTLTSTDDNGTQHWEFEGVVFRVRTDGALFFEMDGKTNVLTRYVPAASKVAAGSPKTSATPGTAASTSTPASSPVVKPKNENALTMNAIVAGPVTARFPNEEGVEKYLTKYRAFYLERNETLENVIKPKYKEKMILAIKNAATAINTSPKADKGFFSKYCEGYILPVFNETTGAKSKYIFADYNLCKNGIHAKNKVAAIVPLLLLIRQYNKEVDTLLAKHMLPYKQKMSSPNATYLWCGTFLIGDKAVTPPMQGSRFITLSGNMTKDTKGKGGRSNPEHIPCRASYGYVEWKGNVDIGGVLDGMGNLVETWNGWGGSHFLCRDDGEIKIALREGQF